MPLTNIQILRSAVPYKRPDPSFLLDGQLALNHKSEEPGLFTKLQNGDMIKLGPTAITTNGDAPNANPDPAGVAGNLVAEKWFDARPEFYSGVERIWDGTQWNLTNGFTIDDATGDMLLDRNLTVLELRTGGLSGPGADVNFDGNLMPNGTSCVHDIGGAAQRWNSVYGCGLDVDGDALVGNDLSVLNNTSITGSLDVDGTLNVNGQTNTFGQDCNSGAFTVETPAFFNCDTTFIGGIAWSGDDFTLGNGCLSSSLTVAAVSAFDCVTTFNDNILPGTDNAIDIGSPTQRFANMYTGDLHLKNERGDWTLIEEEDCLTLRNNKTGQRFAISMTPYEQKT